MGCDIHMRVEYRTLDGRLEKKLSNWMSGDYYKKIDNEYYLVDLYSNRNYLMFARLADVRNGFGIPPIDRPRGLPQDVTEEVKREAKYFNDYFSHSYFTLAELVKANKEYIEIVCEDEDRPVWPFKRYEKFTALDDLVQRLTARADDLFYFVDDEAMENIRIIFWFDN